VTERGWILIRVKLFMPVLLGLLIIGGVSTAGGAAGSTVGQSPKAACIWQGLAPISVDVRVSVRGLPEVSIPILEIGWSGATIPASCRLGSSVAADVEVRFSKVPKEFSFSYGYPRRWQVFRGAHRGKSHGRTGYEGASVEGEALGCIRSVRARLRYRVLTPGGAVVAQRVRSTPAHYSRCPKKLDD
jgi:hypothetical protein